MSRDRVPQSRPLRILNVIRFPAGGIRSYLRYRYARLPPEVYETTIVTVDRPDNIVLSGGQWVNFPAAPVSVAGNVATSATPW